MKILDDEQPVTIRRFPDKFSEDETKLVYDYRNLNDENRQMITNLMSTFLTAQKVTSV